ncbi:MAG: hypothetical protein FWG50_05665 [Kiritimatiellaeota bacterium]|nr:hypothetical protein [Kiritimatiellota bacterium]
MNVKVWMLAGMTACAAGLVFGDAWETLEGQFRTVPMEARRFTGPLFWMHGDEPQELLESMVDKVAEGHNGILTAESRPHKDWLGEGWYRDVAIVLERAKKNNLHLMLFDDYWWPSQMMGGRVPEQYGSKVLEAVRWDSGDAEPTLPQNVFRVLAAKRVGEDAFDGTSLRDITARVKDGAFGVEEGWSALAFGWKFTGKNGPFGGQQRFISVDGADRECVDWFLKAVYQPHYERFGKDFGKTITGFFYDEPETQGDWGADMLALAAERGWDLNRFLVAYKFKLAGDEQAAGWYGYLNCFVESWGRTMYGGMTKWCKEHGVFSSGHFMEHGNDIFHRGMSGGNMMQLMKYSDMGCIDLVCEQVYPGQRNMGLYQMPKIASSISHVYDKKDDIAWSEIFGGYFQKLTYPDMKWLCDWHQVRGVNFMIPHSFNPRSPRDKDYPPYFHNGGFEPRWPLYRVWADYNNRLATLLVGGYHVAPIAQMHIGLSFHAGKTVRPEAMTTSIQDALLDCDWVPYDALEGAAIVEKDSRWGGRTTLRIAKETFPVLILPAAEVVPYEVMAKAKAFFDKGGVVIGHGIRPSVSATVGRKNAEIQALASAIFDAKANAAGGVSAFFDNEPSEAAWAGLLANVPLTVRVVKGEGAKWVHAMHRVKEGRDVFLICSQHKAHGARPMTFELIAKGEPERWDPMRNEVTRVPYRRVADNKVQVDLTLVEMESVLIVFNPAKRPLPVRFEETPEASRQKIAVTRKDDVRVEMIAPEGTTRSPVTERMTCEGAFSLPNIPKGARVFVSFGGIDVEDALRVKVNGKEAGGFIGAPYRLDVTQYVTQGANTMQTEPFAVKEMTVWVVPD